MAIATTTIGIPVMAAAAAAAGVSPIPSRVPKVQKLATLTICIVPPPSADEVWEQLTRARTQLKDPGLFRWPPHVNLLYPFLKSNDDDPKEGQAVVDSDILRRLELAIQRVEPFTITLNRFGTFGGKKRGVLWLYPSSTRDGLPGDESLLGEPVHTLYQSLINEFPECTGIRDFNPHMTLSHFESLEDAEEARVQIEKWWPSEKCVQFVVTEIYLLQRHGDDGQFKRIVSLGLGKDSTIQVENPPLPFPDMPLLEEDWVRAERMKLKARRNGGPRKWKNTDKVPLENEPRGRSRSADTPEEIAAKRASRATKRLEQQVDKGAPEDE
jgi:2'-5' RNA ligase